MITAKRCTKCRELKPLKQYYEDPRTLRPDGKMAACKKCRGKQSQKWQEKNRDKLRIYLKEWREKNKKRPDRYIQKRKKYPEMLKAHNAANKHIKDSQPCEICGELKTEKHHGDYSKPLEVRFLCRQHHLKLHHFCNLVKKT